MDPQRFDRLAKTLSTPGTRRGALAALLAGSLSLLGRSQLTQGRKRRGGGEVTIQGPCGDGSGPANECDRHRDCCTRICERTGPNTAKRCRCRSRGEPCTRTRNCCQGTQDLVCDGGRCQPASDPEEVCAGGTCETSFPTCENDPDCQCFQTLDGVGFCRRADSSSCAAACSAAQPCAVGEVCLINTCCPGDGTTCAVIAQTACSAVPAAAAAARGADPLTERGGP